MRSTSNNNELRQTTRRIIPHLVPTVAAIIFASAALLSTTPSTHALVAPPRQALPSRADRTVLRYLDDPTDAEPVFRDVLTLEERAKRPSLAPTTMPSSRPDATWHEVPSAAPSSSPSSGLSPYSLLRSLPSSVASLWAQARTVAEEDRRSYFDFVQNQSPDVDIAAESALATGFEHDEMHGKRRRRLPSSVASLWAQARTVAEEDRRQYFDFIKNQSLDVNIAMESALATGLESHEELLQAATDKKDAW